MMFLKISQNSQESTGVGIYFLIKLQAFGLQLYEKRYSNTAVFLWILRNFSEYIFYRIPLVATSVVLLFETLNIRISFFTIESAIAGELF